MNEYQSPLMSREAIADVSMRQCTPDMPMPPLSEPLSPARLRAARRAQAFGSRRRRPDDAR